MFSRLDVVLIAGWLVAGTMAVESHRRLDLTPADDVLEPAAAETAPAPTQPVPAQITFCRPAPTAAQPAPGRLTLTESVALGDGASGFMFLFADDCPR